jgi:hypothetical protein
MEAKGMSAEPDYSSYSKCMEEIKRRQRAIDDILSGNQTTSFRYTNVEFVCLQFRKIFELIILASLASHSHMFEGLTRKLSKEWQIGKIIDLVKRRNAAFYPRPINRLPSDKPGVKDEWTEVATGFLTVEKLIAAHGLIGNIMHANNPYKEEFLLDGIEREFPTWREEVIRLLNNHLVEFPDDNSLLYVGMQNERGQVHMNLFAKV